MTALNAQARATGLVAYKALIDHAIENGLQAPTSMDLREDALNVWISGDASKWVDSIHVDDTSTHDGAAFGRQIVHVTGRLPLLGVKVQLRYSRRIAPAGLRAVTAS